MLGINLCKQGYDQLLATVAAWYADNTSNCCWPPWNMLRGLKSLAPSAVLLPALLVSSGTCRDSSQTGLKWSDNALRMNQIQVVGTHNSYHVETQLAERDAQSDMVPGAFNLWYSHSALDIQLEHQNMRNLELDVLADPEGGMFARPLIRLKSDLPYPQDPAYNESGIKVMHMPDLDVNTVCTTFISCLGIIKAWMDWHPDAVPIPIMIEFKTAEKRGADAGGAKIIPWDNSTLLDGIDEEIRSVFPMQQLITPDDIRRGEVTLEASVLKSGWPDLDSARGRIFFLMDNGPDDAIRYKYRDGHPNLEGRVLFTNAAPGDSDCAFQKLNDPTSDKLLANIQKQVASGYWVRTRADTPLNTVFECSTAMRDAAFKSGAQIVSTDFPAYGMSSRWGCDYAATLPGGRPARCNPVNAPDGCNPDKLEPQWGGRQ